MLGKSTSTSTATLVLTSRLGLPSSSLPFFPIFVMDVFFLSIKDGCGTEEENSYIRYLILWQGILLLPGSGE